MKMLTVVIAACAGMFALMQTDLAQAAYPSVPQTTSQQTPSPPPLSKEARRDLGCVGYYGRASGETKNGKCIRKKRGASVKS
jgi:hypothetical protein